MKKRKKKRISAGGIFFTIIIVFLSLILVGQGIYIMSEMKDSDRLYYADEDDFIRRFTAKLRTVWADDKKTINEIRKILDALGRPDVVEELDSYLKHKAKPLKKNMKNVFVVQGDYVVDKHVDNEVNGVSEGGTGIELNKKII